MNVVGYIREPLNAEGGDTMFAQSERVRRWVARNGYHLVALCQDTAATRRTLDGFRALMGILARGQADLVVLPGLESLSPDKVVQELLLMRLRKGGMAVASTEEADHEDLSEPAMDPARMLIRDILVRSEQYREMLEIVTTPPTLTLAPTESSPAAAETDVLIEISEASPTTASAS